MPGRIITYAHRSKRPPHKKKAVPLAGPASVTERRCAKCGGAFAAKRDVALYCSSPCRQAAYTLPAVPPADQWRDL